MRQVLWLLLVVVGLMGFLSGCGNTDPTGGGQGAPPITRPGKAGGGGAMAAPVAAGPTGK
jgi:hypothetical protein